MAVSLWLDPAKRMTLHFVLPRYSRTSLCTRRDTGHFWWCRARVDQAAMYGALEVEGNVIGVLANNLR